MFYFAIQVWTGHEEEFVRRCEKVHPHEAPLRIYIPTRRLNIRKNQKNKQVDQLVFPGYVFLENEQPELDHALRWQLRSTTHFVRLLPDTRSPKPMAERDKKLLAHFISFHKKADMSKVYFDENDRIVVIDGPLKGLEGQIVKVNRRKERVKVRLDMCGDSFQLDLGIEILERLQKGSPTEHADS
jgi:transcriptional antiterminator NusG